MRRLPNFVQGGEVDDLSRHGREIHNERVRAHRLHDDHGQSMERKDYDNPEWLPVVVEEVGEVARAICEMRKHPHMWKNLREELIQVMAMCSAWVDAIDMMEENMAVPVDPSPYPLASNADYYQEGSPPPVTEPKTPDAYRKS